MSLVGKSVAIFAAALVLFWSGSVAASGSPPDTYLRSGGERLQKGVQGSSCWGDLCSEVFNDYPTAVSVEQGAVVRIRFRKARKPSELALSAYRRVNDRGEGRGEPDSIQYRLVSHSSDGVVVAWDAIFKAKGTRHFYLGVFGEWGDNDSSWKFHFKTV